ncbi:unnamed protein product [Lampetra fluviatilis]
MSTRRRVRVRVSDNEDDEELIPPTATEEGAKTLPVEQGAVGVRSTSPSLEELVRIARSHLTDLLQAASSILVEMRSLPSTAKEMMLGFAKDLHTVLPAKDGEVSSLKIARYIQAQQNLQRDRVLVACSASFAEPKAHADEEPGSACSLHQPD